MYILIKCKRDIYYDGGTENLAVSMDATKLRSLASDDLAKTIEEVNKIGQARFADWEEEVFDRPLRWVLETESEEVNISIVLDGYCTFTYIIEEVTQL